jgi:GNAT superfamily N-acetyltransferase
MRNEGLGWRRATRRDLPLLAEWNRRLIVDERAWKVTLGDVPFLRRRLRRWLSGPYRAVLFHRLGVPVAYALYRKREQGVYLRQFYVDRPRRRDGVGRAAWRLLFREVLPKKGDVSVDVLLHNRRGMAFWHAAGFRDRAMRMVIHRRER